VRFTASNLFLLLMLSLGMSHGQRSTPSSPRINFSDPNGIIHQLAPDDWPSAQFAIDPLDRAMVIRLLSEAKRVETGWHKQLAIYFLICLDQNYSENIRDLLRFWRSGVGDEDTMGLIILVYKHGHQELLEPILKAGQHSDGALSEELGDFYGDELTSHTRVFVSALSGFSPKDQDSICWLAGGADGGGMGAEAEARAVHNLMALKSAVSSRCARNVRKGNADAEASNQ